MAVRLKIATCPTLDRSGFHFSRFLGLPPSLPFLRGLRALRRAARVLAGELFEPPNAPRATACGFFISRAPGPWSGVAG